MDIKTIITAIIVMTVTGTVTLLFTPWRIKLTKKWRDAVIRYWKKEEQFNAQHAEREQQINDHLVELRVRSESCRAYVFKFHNGEYFSPKDPLWKTTCTNENCRAGVSYKNRACRAILNSSIIEIISPIFGGSCSNGIGVIDTEGCTCETKCVSPHGVFYYEVNNMSECSSKAFLIEHGIQKMLLSPLIDGNRIYGFVGIDYTTDISIEDVKANQIHLCNSTRDIGFKILGIK